MFTDGYWCRTLTAGSASAMRRPTDCQVLERTASQLFATRERGTGVSFAYDIE